MKNAIAATLLAAVLVTTSSILADDTTYVMPKKIVLSGTVATKNTLQGKFLQMVYTEAFRRLGIEMGYKAFPAARASHMSSLGETDGEISRVREYGATRPNMVRVDEPVFTYVFNAYAVKPGIKLNGWESLKGTNYKVECRLGVKKSELNLAKYVSSDNLSAIASLKRGIEKLISGRTDVLVGITYIMDEELQRKEFQDKGIYVAGTLDSSTTSHAYLHKKHAPLVPKLSAVLKQMKKEGLIEAYRKQAFNIK